MNTEHWLRIIEGNDVVTINFKDNQASRAAAIAGLAQSGVRIEAWDIDENGRRWEKDV